MIRFFSSCLILCLYLVDTGIGFGQSQTKDKETTTWLIVRHADRDGEKDALTEAGFRRADQLGALMKALRVDSVYSTNTQRTEFTAAPTAKALGLTVQSYGGLKDNWFEQIKLDHVGGVVMIVAHSNTAGKIVEGLGGQGDFTLKEDEYDSLFIVTTTPKEVKAVRIKFGD